MRGGGNAENISQPDLCVHGSLLGGVGVGWVRGGLLPHWCQLNAQVLNPQGTQVPC